MAYPVGSILLNSKGTAFLVETNNTVRQFPDAGTLAALTLEIGSTGAPTTTDATLAAMTSGAAFASVAAYATANPRIVAAVQRIVRALIPSTGLSNLAGGMMTIVESSAALFSDAIANPGNWAAPIQGGSKTNPLPSTFSAAAAQAITKLLNTLLNQLINSALSDDQTTAVQNTVNDVADDVDDTDDGDDIPTKDEGDKETVKEAGDKEGGEKETGTKDAGDKEPGDKEPGDKEPGDKEPGDKEPGDKEPGEKEPGEKEPGEKEPGEKEPGDKDGDENGDDGGGDGAEDVARKKKKKTARTKSKQALHADPASPSRDGTWDKFTV